MRPNLLSASFIALLLCHTSPAHAQAGEPLCAYYGGHASVEGKLGNERDIGETALFLPLACNEDTLLFTDLRFRGDNQSNREGNVGLGIRFLKDDGILGLYGYFDRKKSGFTDKYHNQATLGTEWLAESWEVRANGYIPLTGEKTVGTAGGSSSPFLQGSSIYVEETATNLIKEEGMYGGDIEAGFKLPDTNLWLHAAGFAFDSEDAENSIRGGRVRATYQLTENIALLAEGQHDNERGCQGWIGARLTIPFGGPAQKPKGLKARMTTNPVRDIDIVTSTKVEKKGVDRVYEVTNVESGTAQRVIYVDNSNTDIGGGNGTRENPFTTLAAAQAAMQDFDIVYIAAGNSTSSGMDNGFEIARNNVQIIGSGSAFVYDGSRLTSGAYTNPDGFTLIQAAARPTLTNSALVNLSGDAIYVSGANTSISGVSVNGAQRYGIFANANGQNLGDLTITDVDTNNNGSRGLYVYANNNGQMGDIRLSNLDTSNNAGGIIVQSDAGTSIDNVYINDLVSNDNTGGNGRGLYIRANGGTIGTIDLDNIEANGNNVQGVFLLANTATGRINSIDIDNVETNNNVTNTGLYIQAEAGSIGNVTVDDVTSHGNQNSSNSAGVQIRVNTSGTIDDIALNNLDLQGNGSPGLWVRMEGVASVVTNLTLRNSVITGNLRHGILINDDSTMAYTIDLGSGTAGRNSIYGNGTFNPATFSDLNLDLDGGSINAQNNWWGQAGGPTGSQITNEGVCPSCGTADTTGALGSDPN